MIVLCWYGAKAEFDWGIHFSFFLKYVVTVQQLNMCHIVQLLFMLIELT